MMLKFIYFSDLFKPLTQKARFLSIVITRFIRLLFSSKKRLELIDIHYTHKYLFHNSYLIINFHFKHAIWYRLKNIGATEKSPFIFSADRIKSDTVILIAYGFFQKKSIQLSFRPENILVSGRFRTKVERINKHYLFIPPLSIIPQKQNLTPRQLSVNKPQLLVRFTPFTPTEFV